MPLFNLSNSNNSFRAEVDKAYGYYTPISTDTITMPANQQRAVIDPAGTIAALTVTLPPSPVDGQIAGLACSQIVTVLTLNAPGGASVVAAVTSFAVDGNYRYLYRAATTSWYPAP